MSRPERPQRKDVATLISHAKLPSCREFSTLDHTVFTFVPMKARNHHVSTLGLQRETRLLSGAVHRPHTQSWSSLQRPASIKQPVFKHRVDLLSVIDDYHNR
ncbi:MAG: hypothetical protein M2R45_00137 [Verrucomicrobia subdivision 3 bacterium]|nr:hypothetical protein [Limisphaerales bacterium]MCS1412403.1 hypothetical protein [Limisphaerales bacterium]